MLINISSPFLTWTSIGVGQSAERIFGRWLSVPTVSSGVFRIHEYVLPEPPITTRKLN